MFRPSLGRCCQESSFSNEGIGTGRPQGGLETARGPIATACMDVNISERWFARSDLRCMHADAGVNGAGEDTGETLGLDPWTLGVGVGARLQGRTGSTVALPPRCSGPDSCVATTAFLCSPTLSDGTDNVSATPTQATTMPTVMLRVTGGDDSTNQLIHALEAIEGIERVEEIADLMPRMDDEDSSSAGLPDDEGPGLHNIEVEAPNEEGVRRVHAVVERMAVQAELAIEIVDEF